MKGSSLLLLATAFLASLIAPWLLPAHQLGLASWVYAVFLVANASAGNVFEYVDL